MFKLLFCCNSDHSYYTITLLKTQSSVFILLHSYTWYFDYYFSFSGPYLNSSTIIILCYRYIVPRQNLNGLRQGESDSDSHWRNTIINVKQFFYIITITYSYYYYCAPKCNIIKYFQFYALVLLLFSLALYVKSLLVNPLSFIFHAPFLSSPAFSQQRVCLPTSPHSPVPSSHTLPSRCVVPPSWFVAVRACLL